MNNVNNWRHNLEWMSKADIEQDGFNNFTNEDYLSLLQNYENLYQRNTNDHLKLFKLKNYEGNVDERNWFRIAIHLNKQGLLYNN